MTEKEIALTKHVIGVKVQRSLEQFIGQPVGDALDVVKYHINATMKDMLLQERIPSVVDLLEWDVTMDGSKVNAVLMPKSGLNDKEYNQAILFLLGRAF